MSANLKKTSSAKIQLKKQQSKKSSLPFTKENYYLFFAGLGIILIGYVCMATPPVNGFLSLTLSPILVCIGYLVVIPVALLYRKRENENSNQRINE